MRRPPLWRIAVLLGVLLVVAVMGIRRLPRHPDRSPVGLRGHTAPIGSSGSPWPEAMHDAGHSGTSAVRGPQTGQVRWSRRLDGIGTPGPVVDLSGRILVATDKGVLHALDPLTGKDVWTFDSDTSDGSDLSVSPAVLPSGVIVWPAPGALIGLSPSGALLWRLHLPGSPTSPAVVGSGVVVGDSAGWVSRITVPTTGAATVTWQVRVGQSSYGSVAVSPSGRVFQSVDDALVALNATGAVLWRRGLPSPVEVSPAVTPDGGVVVAAGGNLAYGFDPTGGLRWKHDRRAQTYSSPVVTSDGLVAFGDHAGIVTVLDAMTGTLAARYPLLGHRQYRGPSASGAHRSSTATTICMSP